MTIDQECDSLGLQIAIAFGHVLEQFGENDGIDVDEVVVAALMVIEGCIEGMPKDSREEIIAAVIQRLSAIKNGVQ